ncbi:MAG: hypothetical protein Kow00123_06400 [Anaerolineales bacterium]
MWAKTRLSHAPPRPAETPAHVAPGCRTKNRQPALQDIRKQLAKEADDKPHMQAYIGPGPPPFRI